MPSFLIRDIHPAQWAALDARAKREGWPLRPLILQLLADYADGRISPSHGPAPGVRRWQLTLQGADTFGAGGNLAGRQALQYDVGGLPLGQHAVIVDAGDGTGWRVERSPVTIYELTPPTFFEQRYGSPEVALAALTALVEDEKDGHQLF
jgi:hypothetical protein